jgi:hypothetical protein
VPSVQDKLENLSNLIEDVTRAMLRAVMLHNEPLPAEDGSRSIIYLIHSRGIFLKILCRSFDRPFATDRRLPLQASLRSTSS